jgi:hypothetical protein
MNHFIIITEQTITSIGVCRLIFFNFPLKLINFPLKNIGRALVCERENLRAWAGKKIGMLFKLDRRPATGNWWRAKAAGFTQATAAENDTGITMGPSSSMFECEWKTEIEPADQAQQLTSDAWIQRPGGPRKTDMRENRRIWPTSSSGPDAWGNLRDPRQQNWTPDPKHRGGDETLDRQNQNGGGKQEIQRRRTTRVDENQQRPKPAEEKIETGNEQGSLKRRTQI